MLCAAGNNAVEMQTTATWDMSSGRFIIHSPTTLSQKYWITNSAVHAQWCVVFAQLMMDGRNQGIHGFLVRCVTIVTKVQKCHEHVMVWYRQFQSSYGFDGRLEPEHPQLPRQVRYIVAKVSQCGTDMSQTSYGVEGPQDGLLG
jgi:hypothetical protein